MKYIQTAAFGLPEYELKAKPVSCRPRICQTQYRQLRQQAQRTGKTITQLVAEALDSYFVNSERR